MEWLLGIAGIELILNILVRGYRRSFQWLITAKDSHPKLDPVGLKKFIGGGYDPELGWVRKPHTSGSETRGDLVTHYSIDAMGCRSDVSRTSEPRVAVFGDSYAFCRQVNNDETWEFFLGEMLGVDILNYGVGNYGVDQSLLRFEREPLPESVSVVVMAFVPETICRVLSYWKHYLEFGNTFAFKPRFVLKGTELVLVPSAMNSGEVFSHYEDKLNMVQAHDFFYEHKFRKLQFRFPYIISFMRSPQRHFRLLGSLVKRSMSRLLGRNSSAVEDAPFSEVMRFNTSQAYQLYDNVSAVNLLRAVFMRFASKARERGCQPVVLVMPQLTDFKLSAREREGCDRFYRELGKDILTVDASLHLPNDSLEKLYTSDQYGGHFSPEGNREIAKIMKKFIGTILLDKD